MPKIKAYKSTADVLEGYADDTTIPAKWFETFKARLPEGYTLQAHPSDPYGWLEWSPDFPFASYLMGGSSITEEALYRSNHRVIAADFEETQEVGTFIVEANCILLRDDSTRAIARAKHWELLLDDLVEADDQDVSDLQTELEEEAYNDYGRDDLIKILSRFPEVEEFFDSEDMDSLAPEYAPYVERYLRQMARDAVGYCGEMYFGYHTQEGNYRDCSLKYCLEEIAGVYSGWKIEQLLEMFRLVVQLDKAKAEQALFEETQPPLINVPREEN